MYLNEYLKTFYVQIKVWEDFFNINNLSFEFFALEEFEYFLNKDCFKKIKDTPGERYSIRVYSRHKDKVSSGLPSFSSPLKKKDENKYYQFIKDIINPHALHMLDNPNRNLFS